MTETVIPAEEFQTRIIATAMYNGIPFGRLEDLERAQAQHISDCRYNGFDALSNAWNCFFLETVETYNSAVVPAVQRKVSLHHAQLIERLLHNYQSLCAAAHVARVGYATQKTKNYELRDEIKKLFKQSSKDPALLLKLKAILNKCEVLSEKRNRLLHNAWAIAPDGSIVTKGEDHAWGQAATPEDLNNLAGEIIEQVSALNEARLHGFIGDVMQKVDTAKRQKPTVSDPGGLL